MCTRAPASRASSASRATIDSSAARGQPARPEPGGVRSLVGDGADGEPRLFGMLGDQHAKARGVLERAAHDQRVVHADAVVGEHPHLPGTGGHHAHLGELGARQPHGDGADGMHVDEPDLLAPVPDVVGDDRDCRRPDWCWPSRTPRCSHPMPLPPNRFRCPRRTPARARAGGCAGRRSPGSRIWPVASMTSASSGIARSAPMSAIWPASTSTSTRSPSP